MRDFAANLWEHTAALVQQATRAKTAVQTLMTANLNLVRMEQRVLMQCSLTFAHVQQDGQTATVRLILTSAGSVNADMTVASVHHLAKMGPNVPTKLASMRVSASQVSVATTVKLISMNVHLRLASMIANVRRR